MVQLAGFTGWQSLPSIPSFKIFRYGWVKMNFTSLFYKQYKSLSQNVLSFCFLKKTYYFVVFIKNTIGLIMAASNWISPGRKFTQEEKIGSDEKSCFQARATELSLLLLNTHSPSPRLREPWCCLTSLLLPSKIK